MLLAIDAGNTNTVFALCDGDDLKQAWRCETNASRTGDEYASWLYQVFQISGYNFTDVTDVIVSSVVPDANFNFRNMAQRYFDCKSLFVSTENVIPKIKISIDQPQQAGADLLVNAIACAKHYSANAIIVDFGTATTLSVLTEEGGYSGGIIAPGINLSLDALVSATAKLPKVAIQQPPHVKGTNTVHAMQSGIFWGYVSMIEGLIVRLKAEIKTDPKVIATGGLANVFSAHIDAIECVDKELTLKGLLEIYKSEKEKI